MTSCTQRTLAKLKAEGWTAAIVEKWNPHAGPHGIRQDLWGFADLICFRGEEVLLVQTTSGSNVSARVDKILFNPIAHEWISGMCRRLEVWGWRKVGKKGKPKTWECRVVKIIAESEDSASLPSTTIKQGSLL